MYGLGRSGKPGGKQGRTQISRLSNTPALNDVIVDMVCIDKMYATVIGKYRLLTLLRLQKVLS